MLIQGFAIIVDEFYFHRRRGLPKWEKLGHPLDTFVSFGALLIPTFFTFSNSSLIAYVFASLFSCFFVTKDEWIHTKYCDAAENWLHSVLFLMHPLVFVSFGFFWWDASGAVLGSILNFKALILGQIFIMACFGIYQYVYWNLVRTEN
jgi:hypothetical protein